MEKLILHNGRSDNLEGRQEREIRVYDLLDSLGIEYWQIDHEPAYTMEVCKEIDDVLGATICKNLFLCNRQQTEFYLLMMPDDKPFKTKDITGQLGCSRLSFATAEKMEELLDIHPGSVSVMGLMNDHENKVQLVVDEDVLNSDFVGCHPCVNTSSLKLRTPDIFTTFLTAVHHDYRVVKL